MQVLEYNQIHEKIKRAKYIIIDRKISELYPEIAELLGEKVVFELSHPEQQKNLKDFESALNFFLENSITRSDKLMAIGGGATSDFAGFVAASILRGIKWEIIPTTLLAMIDASIGGKTGLNTDQGKNLVGAFHQPEDIYLNLDFLKTLPPEQYRSGLGELLKYTFLNEDIYKLVKNKAPFSEIVFACAKFKEQIVEEDFKEGGKRKILNLGHTIGHAIEKVTGIAHGDAVAWGLFFVIDIYTKELKTDLKNIMLSLNYELVDLPKFDFEKLFSLLIHDKKRKTDGTIEFILANAPGEIVIKPIDINQIKKDLLNNELFSNYCQ